MIAAIVEIVEIVVNTGQMGYCLDFGFGLVDSVGSGFGFVGFVDLGKTFVLKYADHKDQSRCLAMVQWRIAWFALKSRKSVARTLPRGELG